MAKQGKSGIGWTNDTWNPVRGCNPVSDGCRNCYAMGVAARFSGPGLPYDGLAYRTTQGPKWTGKIMLVHDALLQPMRWSKPRKIFVNSMSDLFHDDIPDSFIDEVFAVMALADQHIYQTLTKRTARMRKYLSDPHCAQRVFAAMRAITGADLDHSIGFKQPKWPLRNVWIGVSAENQETLQQRVDDLFYTPAAVRWLSLEPLLGRIDLCETFGMYWNSTMKCFEATGQRLNYGRGRGGIDWVVLGGESGHGARAMHPSWPLAIQRQCKAAGVAYFHKQNGEWQPVADYCSDDAARDEAMDGPHDLLTPGGSLWDEKFDGQPPPGTWIMRKVGKKRAGRLLDGVLYDEYPEEINE